MYIIYVKDDIKFTNPVFKIDKSVHVFIIYVKIERTNPVLNAFLFKKVFVLRPERKVCDLMGTQEDFFITSFKVSSKKSFFMTTIISELILVWSIFHN